MIMRLSHVISATISQFISPDGLTGSPSAPASINPTSILLRMFSDALSFFEDWYVTFKPKPRTSTDTNKLNFMKFLHPLNLKAKYRVRISLHEEYYELCRR